MGMLMHRHLVEQGAEKPAPAPKAAEKAATETAAPKKGGRKKKEA